MSSPISVIIPVYNRKTLIKRAIESVLIQSHSDFELIIIDDCSTDGTDLSINLFEDSRLTYFKLAKNSGNAVARNKGVQLARGELICFLDSDDFYEPDYLEKMVEFAGNHPSDDFFWTGINLVDESESKFGERSWSPKGVLPGITFFHELQIGTNNGVCFRRTIFDQFSGFNENLRAAVDREFFLRISQSKSGRGILSPLVNCTFGAHESVRKNYSAQAEAYLYLIEEFRAVILSDKNLTKNWYHKAMWLNYYAGEKSKSFKLFFKIPFNLNSFFVFLIFSFLPLSTARRVHRRFGNKGFRK